MYIDLSRGEVLPSVFQTSLHEYSDQTLIYSWTSKLSVRHKTEHFPYIENTSFNGLMDSSSQTNHMWLLVMQSVYLFGGTPHWKGVV